MAGPVYPEIKAKIEKAIRKGEWTDRLPSTFQLAKRFGTSHLTVLKAIKMLKDDGKVVVKERQGTYIARNSEARPFSPYIGVVGFSEDPRRIPLEYYYLQAIKNYLEAHGSRMLSIQHFDELDLHFARTLTDMRVGGYLFTNGVLTQEMVDMLKLEGVPFVSLNRIDRIDGIAWASFDAGEGLKCLLRHYLASGHKRIALARRQAPFLLAYSEEQLNIYRDTLQAAGVYQPELLHIYDNDLIFRIYEEPEVADEIAENMFKQYYCCENPPTALHIDPEGIARAFLRKICREAPDWAKTLALSTVSGSPEQDADFSADFPCTLLGDYAELARVGVEVLSQRIADPNAPVQRVFVPMSLRIHRKVKPGGERGIRAGRATN